jgi:hypothetical protein
MGSIEDRIAELLAKHGASKEDFDILPDPEEKKDPPELVQFRGEAVLYALEYPLSPRVTKVCSSCKEPFQSYYKSVGHCSQECRVRALREHFGLAWSPNRELKKEKWEVRAEPRTIPLKALQAMKAIVAQAEADLGYSIVLPEIQPFVPKSSYWRNQDTAFSSENDFRISVSPIPLEQNLEELQSLVSQSDEALLSVPSLDRTGKTAQSPELSESEPSSDPLADLFAL